jgi:hypothetical protein
MKIEGIRGLKSGAKVWINGSEYLIQEVTNSGSSRVLELKDGSGKGYLLKIDPGKGICFYKTELDPISITPIFSEEDRINIKSIDF